MMRSRSSRQSSLIRAVLVLLVICLFIYVWNRDDQYWDNFKCIGPDSAPSTHEEFRSLSPEELSNPHEPYTIDEPTISNIDLTALTTTKKFTDRVLILTPLRDAATHLSTHFALLSQLTYPHDAIDLAFLVGDCTDDTLTSLKSELATIQAETNTKRFRSAMIVQKDFGDTLGQSVEERHSFAAQGLRRKAIGRARNYLLYAALRPVHDWVYWRDVDIVENPETILEDFMAHDKDVLVPNVWFHRYDKDGKDIEGRYDYNSWQESWWGRRLRRRLDKDTILAEGYKEYNAHRRTLNWMGNRHKDPKKEVHLDGIGGVNILVKADVHRSGINFPCYAFENQADTEGFAAMANRAGYSVVGLPNYIVWHIDTEEKEGNLKGRKKDDGKEDED